MQHSVDEGTSRCIAVARSGVSCLLVGGGSGSGKSTVSAILAGHLGCTVLELDRFYHDYTHVPPATLDGQQHPQWDCPKAIDLDLAMACIRSVVLEGRHHVSVPVYSYESNTRIGMEDLAVKSNSNLVVDGTMSHALLDKCRKAMISAIVVYVHAEWSVRVRRIRERDRLRPRRVESEAELLARLAVMRQGEANFLLPQQYVSDVVILSE